MLPISEKIIFQAITLISSNTTRILNVIYLYFKVQHPFVGLETSIYKCWFCPV